MYICHHFLDFSPFPFDLAAAFSAAVSIFLPFASFLAPFSFQTFEVCLSFSQSSSFFFPFFSPLGSFQSPYFPFQASIFTLHCFISSLNSASICSLSLGSIFFQASLTSCPLSGSSLNYQNFSFLNFIRAFSGRFGGSKGQIDLDAFICKNMLIRAQLGNLQLLRTLVPIFIEKPTISRPKTKKMITIQ